MNSKVRSNVDIGEVETAQSEDMLPTSSDCGTSYKSSCLYWLPPEVGNRYFINSVATAIC